MEDNSLDQQIECLIRQDAKINITKKDVGENYHIDAMIEGNPIAAAYAIFRAIEDDDDLFHLLRFFMSRKK